MKELHAMGFGIVEETARSIMHRFNRKVFITPPWKEIYRTDKERDQSYEESIVVYEKLFHWYKSHGYELKLIPEAAVNVRIDFILKEL